MSDNITITLTLTVPEQVRLQALVLRDSFETGGAGDLNNKIARAIERAESFVGAVDMQSKIDLDTVPIYSRQVICAGCNGTGETLHGIHLNGVARYVNCYYCSGTGKEWV